jgi:hypothetical protein
MLGPDVLKGWAKAPRDGIKVLREDQTKALREVQKKARSDQNHA